MGVKERGCGAGVCLLTEKGKPALKTIHNSVGEQDSTGYAHTLRGEMVALRGIFAVGCLCCGAEILAL